MPIIYLMSDHKDESHKIWSEIDQAIRLDEFILEHISYYYPKSEIARNARTYKIKVFLMSIGLVLGIIIIVSIIENIN